MKLELKHLAPYLPYGLRVRVDYYSQHEGRIFNFSPTILLDFSMDEYIVKPILRPLSDLTKGDLDYLLNHHSTDWFADTDFENMIIKYLEHKNLHNFIEFMPFGLVQWFMENHYDIFGLIEKGLAIDINTLNK